MSIIIKVSKISIYIFYMDCYIVYIYFLEFNYYYYYYYYGLLCINMYNIQYIIKDNITKHDNK